MIFTVREMEMLCIFYQGSRAATLEVMAKAACEMFGQLSGRLEDVQSAIEKLERMRDGEAASILLDP